jgi:glycosyltransferase involved in cell wall biosynthesis
MSAALSIPPHSLSIVVPFYNEEDNIVPLVKRVHEALVGYEHPWELVLVDDGSSDATTAPTCASSR